MRPVPRRSPGRVQSGAAFRLAWLLLEQEHSRRASTSRTQPAFRDRRRGVAEEAEGLLEIAAAYGHAGAEHVLVAVEGAMWEARHQPRLDPERLFAHRLLGSRVRDELAERMGIPQGSDEDYPAQDLAVLERLAVCAYPLLFRQCTPRSEPEVLRLGRTRIAELMLHRADLAIVDEWRDKGPQEHPPSHDERVLTSLKAVVLYFDDASGRGTLTVDDRLEPVGFSLLIEVRGRARLRQGEAIELEVRGEPGADDCEAVLIDRFSWVGAPKTIDGEQSTRDRACAGRRPGVRRAAMDKSFMGVPVEREPGPARPGSSAADLPVSRCPGWCGHDDGCHEGARGVRCRQRLGGSARTRAFW